MVSIKWKFRKTYLSAIEFSIIKLHTNIYFNKNLHRSEIIIFFSCRCQLFSTTETQRFWSSDFLTKLNRRTLESCAVRFRVSDSFVSHRSIGARNSALAGRSNNSRVSQSFFSFSIVEGKVRKKENEIKKKRRNELIRRCRLQWPGKTGGLFDKNKRN